MWHLLDSALFSFARDSAFEVDLVVHEWGMRQTHKTAWRLQGGQACFNITDVRLHLRDFPRDVHGCTMWAWGQARYCTLALPKGDDEGQRPGENIEPHHAIRHLHSTQMATPHNACMYPQ